MPRVQVSWQTYWLWQYDDGTRRRSLAIPGVGSLVSYSAINKDFPVVQGVVLVLVLIVISINLAVDIITALLDPRVAAA